MHHVVDILNPQIINIQNTEKKKCMQEGRARKHSFIHCHRKWLLYHALNSVQLANVTRKMYKNIFLFLVT